MGKQWKQWQTVLFWAPKSLQMVIAAMKLKDAFYLEEKYDQPRQHITKQKCYFANKGPSSQGYGFSSSHVWLWELDYKESWVPQNRCFWTWCWRRLLRVPWAARRSNQSILNIRWYDWCWRWNSADETPIVWPCDAKNWLTGEDPDAGEDWRQEVKGITEDEMVGWHHWISGHEFN